MWSYDATPSALVVARRVRAVMCWTLDDMHERMNADTSNAPSTVILHTMVWYTAIVWCCHNVIRITSNTGHVVRLWNIGNIGNIWNTWIIQ